MIEESLIIRAFWFTFGSQGGEHQCANFGKEKGKTSSLVYNSSRSLMSGGS